MNPELVYHLLSLTRFVYYVCEEEDRFLVQLRDKLSKFEGRLFVYNAAFGLQQVTSVISAWQNRNHPESEEMGIHDALLKIYRDDPRDDTNFYVITDPERWLADAHVQRRILNIAHQLHNNDKVAKVIIFAGPRLFIPQKLQRYIEVVHDRGMSEKEVETLVEDLSHKLSTKTPKGVTKLFRGLTSYEIDAAVTQSVIRTKKDKKSPRRVDPRIIGEFKRRQLAKTDLLSYVDVSKEGFNQVGGLKSFKTWAQKTKACWTEEGQKFGLRPPKGVLCVGVWGCGKSLSVKAMGNAWRLPVVQLEMGRLRSSGVGESEANVYRATNIIEAVSPCVTGDTEVTLADGTTVPIEELWQEHPTDLRVMCWNEKSLKAETTRVTAFTRRKAEAFQIGAANGFGLNATANHQHYVLRGGMPEWVRTDGLEPGDMLAVPLNRNDGEDDCTRFHPLGMRIYDRGDGLQDFRRGGGGFRDAVIQKLPPRWSTKLGWLLGALEGDGFIGVRNSIGFSNTSKELLSEFEGILIRLFGLEPVRREHLQDELPELPGVGPDSEFKPCWTTLATNQLAAEFLRSARTNILSAPFQVRAAFLAGWVDADGCISPDKVTLTVKGPKLREERRRLARQLIQSLGVVPSKFDSVNMEITGSRAPMLSALLVEHLCLKAARAKKVSSSDTGFDRGMGFACGALLNEARGGFSIAQVKEAGISTSVLWRHENGTTPISERQLKKYIRLLGDKGKDFQKLLDAECRWVEVRDVKSIGLQDVYDLACEGEDTHSFFANGLITHNCIVWIDEAEKSLAGNQSSALSDAGTTARTIGILSNWLQETDAPVCLAMTANSLTTLPVEFINRMDERFFFTLPSEDECIEILKIHLAKRGQAPDRFQLAGLATAAKNMVGREIEQAIGAAMVESFEQGFEALDPGVLLNEVTTKPRIFKTMVDEMQDIIDWVGYDPEIGDGIRAKFASSERGETFKQFKVVGDK